MEKIISELLHHFETGKMSRRQLIQALAFAMAAGSASGAAQEAAATKPTLPPPNNPTQWKTVWLDHISYAVSDYRRTAAFYRDLLGWEPIHDDGKTQCSMKIGNVGGIIIRNGHKSIFDKERSGEERPPINGVINHISWGIEPWDTDRVRSELEKRGLKPRPDMVGKNFQSFHVLDPEGWDLQISNQKDTSEL